MFLRSEKTERVLVFSRTKHGADKIVRMLEAAGVAANAIHGNKSQANRERALAQFRSGEVPVLIATDIAARGIDIPGVSHVINFDLPEVPEQYVHRIGRTARAGADGQAAAFCSPEERGLLRDIERLTCQRIELASLPADFMARAGELRRLKPAPKKAEQPRFVHASQRTKADRRADGQGREQRNDRQRHPHRGEGHSGHRSAAQDRNGQRRDDQRNAAGRSSYRPEAYREAQTERRPEGQRKRRFRRGGTRRAQG
jgi:ATP-dependent RNA helicase RhlE